MLSREDFRSALEAARDEWHCKNHPFFTSWAAGTLSKGAMKAYCQQHYNFMDGLWLQHVEGRAWFPSRVAVDT